MKATKLLIEIKELENDSKVPEGATGYSVSIEAVNKSSIPKDIIAVNACSAFIANVKEEQSLDMMQESLDKQRKKLKELGTSEKRAKEALAELLNDDDMPESLKKIAAMLFDLTIPTEKK